VTGVSATFVGALVAGLVGSGHCAGMCGPFAAWAGARKRHVTTRTAAYQLGRLLSYLSVGVIAGIAGQALGDTAALASAQGVAAIVAAVVLLLAGISQLLPRKPGATGGMMARISGKLVALSASAGPLTGPLLLGAAAGLLPCGMLWAFALAAAATTSLPAAVAVMAGLWLGSVPALVATAAAAGLLEGRLRKHGRKAVGVALIVLAGFSLVQRWPAPEQSPAQAAEACCHDE